MDQLRQFNPYSKEHVETKIFDKVLIRKLYHYIHPYRYLVCVAILLMLISKAIEAAVPIFIGDISQKMLSGFSLDFLAKSTLLHHILSSCAALLGLLGFGYLLDSANVLIKSWIGQKALFELRQEVYEHILRLPLAYFDKHAVGRLMTRTIHDVDQINQMFAESIVPLIGNLFLFVCIFAGILYIDWTFALVFLTMLIPMGYLTNHFRYHQRRCYEKIRLIVSAMNTFVQEHLMGAATIRNFNLKKTTRRQFEQINEDHRVAYLDSMHYFSFFVASIDFIQNVFLILVFVLLVSMTPIGEGFQAGTFFTFSLYALMIFRPLLDLAERYNVLQAAMAAAGKIFNMLDQHKESDRGKIELSQIESLSFEEVWFAYEDENWVLKGLTFESRKGESLAIVGFTGEGKTTIISLLLRFYNVQKGSIKINGRDIKDYTLSSLRKQFSVVLQDPVIFSGTISDNIGLYSPEISQEQITEAAQYLNLFPLIETFPDKWEHQLSERGKSLSMGEMQLISMARAIAHYRSVLILDEATANIDSNTEKMIQNALQKILKEKTSLVIAHRLSTIKDVSRILVLYEGQAAEIGSHEELLKSKGIYEKLYRLQFASE